MLVFIDLGLNLVRCVCVQGFQLDNYLASGEQEIRLARMFRVRGKRQCIY